MRASTPLKARPPATGAGAAPSDDRWRELRAGLAATAASWVSTQDGTEEVQERVAQAICAEVIHALWDERTDRDRSWLAPWVTRGLPSPLHLKRLAQEAALALGAASLIEAAFRISGLYTALLPPRVRSSRGAFYTPPVLAERLLDMLAGEGVDWLTVRALDPACGGGAFLAPLANRIVNDHRIRSLAPEEALHHLEERLCGIELDAFAAWMSATFLQLLVLPLSQRAGRPLRAAIRTADALRLLPEYEGRFDLVVGNPPYGRISLAPDERDRFQRSLFGHANLYGLFLDAALRWRNASGFVAFVTPTSFLGGQYFSRLRHLLLQTAPPLMIDFVAARSGVFDSVLQETCLAVFGPNPGKTTVVHLLEASDRTAKATRTGTFSVKQAGRGPWFLPRSAEQGRLVGRAGALRTRLHDLGFKASTGPLVWNRHKPQLRGRPGPGTYPLIWAEAVKSNRFSFEYCWRAESPFFSVQEGQDHLLCQGPCVLVQRTTAKEQDRRLIACAIPPRFLKQWRAVVIENHVNVLRAAGADHVAPRALAAVLNTDVVDQVFRCFSGTVAVSATELHALPLPPREVFAEVATLLSSGEDPDGPALRGEVERIVARAYGVEAP